MRTVKLMASLWILVVVAASAESLKVVLSAVRTTYAMSDHATFQVALVNASDERISVYRILQWGYAAGFVPHVFDEKGNRVNLRAYDDYVPIPSTLSKPDSYVILEPDHLLGTLRTDKFSDWGVKPGSYTIEVEYRSPVPGKYHNEAQFWSREKGVLRSNSITLHILP